MRVLAIDPGVERMGVAVVERNAGKDTLLYSSCLITSKKDSQEKRLLVLGKELRSLITTYTPEFLAAEELFFNTNQKTALQVAEARGVALFIAAEQGLPVFGFNPLEVKMALCGYGRADKVQVTEMVKRLVKIGEGKILDDEYDAIAVGLTFLASHKTIAARTAPLK